MLCAWFCEKGLEMNAPLKRVPLRKRAYFREQRGECRAGLA